MKRISIVAILALSLISIAYSDEISDIFNGLKDNVTEDKLKNQQQELITYDEEAVKALLIEDREESAEDYARDVLKAEAQKEGSAVNSAVGMPTLNTNAEKQLAEDELMKDIVIPDDIEIPDLREYLAASDEDDEEDDINKSITDLYIADKVIEEASEKLGTGTEDQFAEKEAKMKDISIFAGDRLKCEDYEVWYKPMAKKCSLNAKVEPYYTCEEDSQIFQDYDSCANVCASVCKKKSDYEDPNVDIFGIDITNLVGVTEEEKKLAVARAYNECYADGSEKIRKRLHGKFSPKVTVGRKYYYCCFDNPLTKEFNVVAREQLRALGHTMPTGCGDGIPFDKLQYVNFDDPRITDAMKKHMNSVVDPAMLNDLENIYNNKKANAQPAEDMESKINDKVQQSRIPGF